MLGFVLEFGRALLQLLLQLCDGIMEIVGAIVDGRIAEGDVALIAYCDLRVHVRRVR
jgi:hypothetical protein